MKASQLGKESRISFLLSLATMLFIISAKVQPAAAWQMGWSTTASVNDWGAGSYAAVSGGLNCVACTFELTTGFYDLGGTWHTDFILDSNDGSTIQAIWEYTFNGYYYDTGFSSCSTFNSGYDYTQRIYWVGYPSYNWVYTNSNCTGVGYHAESSSYAGIEQYNSYMGSIDMLESNAPGQYFNNAAATAAFDTSLEYMTTGGTWYTASNTYVYEYLGGAPSNGPGADYGCSTPWLFFTSAYGGPWSLGSGTTGTSACT